MRGFGGEWASIARPVLQTPEPGSLANVDWVIDTDGYRCLSAGSAVVSRYNIEMPAVARPAYVQYSTVQPVVEVS